MINGYKFEIRKAAIDPELEWWKQESPLCLVCVTLTLCQCNSMTRCVCERQTADGDGQVDKCFCRTKADLMQEIIDQDFQDMNLLLDLNNMLSFPYS